MTELIDKQELLKQLGISARFNADVPAWVIGVIKGLKQPACKDCGYWHNYYCYMHCQIRSADSLCDRLEVRDEKP